LICTFAQLAVDFMMQTREDFMSFFRDDERLDLLTVEDRTEVFSQILLGSSDFEKQLFDELLSDYCAANLTVVDIGANTLLS
jgi:hypothetical protein